MPSCQSSGTAWYQTRPRARHPPAHPSPLPMGFPLLAQTIARQGKPGLVGGAGGRTGRRALASRQPARADRGSGALSAMGGDSWVNERYVVQKQAAVMADASGKNAQP